MEGWVSADPWGRKGSQTGHSSFPALFSQLYTTPHCYPEMTRSILGQLKDAVCGVKGHSTKLGKPFNVLGQVEPYWEQTAAINSFKNNCQVFLGPSVVLSGRGGDGRVGEDRALLETKDGQDTSSHN